MSRDELAAIAAGPADKADPPPPLGTVAIADGAIGRVLESIKVVAVIDETTFIGQAGEDTFSFTGFDTSGLVDGEQISTHPIVMAGKPK